LVLTNRCGWLPAAPSVGGLDRSEYKDILKDYLGVEWTREHDLLMNVSSYLSGEAGNNSDLSLAVNINRLSLLSSGIMLIESAALKQLSSINKEN